MLEQGGLEGRELAVLSRVSGPHTWDSVQSKGDPACSFLPLELSLSSVQPRPGRDVEGSHKYGDWGTGIRVPKQWPSHFRASR